jgi:TetR/AcrR family transcriptional regulator, regulator of mycofactocin system
MTRQRLVDSANRLFRIKGYAATTAAAIAADAGVTERTFYRYFPAKGDVLLSSWQRRREALQRVLEGSEEGVEPIDVVRAAMHEFSEHVRISIDAGTEAIVPLFADADAASVVLQVLLRVEQDLTADIARRTGRSSEDFELRTAAYATVGVFRAAIRAVAASTDGREITALVDDGIGRLQPLFDGLRPGVSSPPGTTPRRRAIR